MWQIIQPRSVNCTYPFRVSLHHHKLHRQQKDLLSILMIKTHAFLSALQFVLIMFDMFAPKSFILYVLSFVVKWNKIMKLKILNLELEKIYIHKIFD